MVLKLYGYHHSTCTRRVAVVLHEKNIPFEFIRIDMESGAHKKPEYLAIQPFGQVPYIDDDGFILYESRAICRYIAAKYASQGTPLVPTGLKAIAKFEEAASIETSNFDPHASGAVAENVFKKFLGGEPNQEVFLNHIAKLRAKLDGYEAILSKQKYIAGNEITLIDLFHLPYGDMLKVAGSDIMNEKPHVAKWFKDISSRPSWQAVKGEVTSKQA